MGTRNTARLTYQDLLEMFPVEDNVRRELIDGELFVTPSATKRHQRVVQEIFVALRAYVLEHGGEAFGVPIDTMFAQDSVVNPDVLYVAPGHEDPHERLQRKVDLVVEVSSPSTRRIDLIKKRDLYERYRVPEYWFVDLESDQFEIYRLVGSRYRNPIPVGRGEHLTTPLLPGFEADVDELLGPEPETSAS